MSSNKEKIIKGIPASGGKAKGKVCKVFNSGEFQKFKRGNVLVTKMTNPTFTPLMAMAKAVVTDMGGVLSHAAIVSREFGVPAVVGTRLATKKLADGDFVEVDGTRGEIKKV